MKIIKSITGFFKNKKGMTLIELLIGLIITTVFTLGFYVLGHNYGNAAQSGMARTQLQREGSLIVEDMVKDIREASGITINNVEGGVNNYIQIISPVSGTTLYWSVDNVPDAGHTEGEFYKNAGGGDELLLGDYNIGGISLNVANMTFTDDMVSNLVTIDLDLQLVRTFPDGATTTLEVVSFNGSSEPRNR